MEQRILRTVVAVSLVACLVLPALGSRHPRAALSSAQALPDHHQQHRSRGLLDNASTGLPAGAGGSSERNREREAATRAGHITATEVLGLGLACVGSLLLLLHIGGKALHWLSARQRPGYVELQEADTYHRPWASPE